MDILTFIATMVGSLAWPAAVVAIAFMFRRSLARLIPGLQRLKFRDVELEFGRQLAEVEEKLGPAPAPPPALPPAEARPGVASEPPPSLRYFQSLAEVSPRAAILEAWLEFEMAANRIVDSLGLNGKGRPLSMQGLFNLLRQQELITSSEFDALTNLRALRNQVVHGPEPAISPGLIAEYATVLRRITDEMERRLGERKS